METYSTAHNRRRIQVRHISKMCCCTIFQQLLSTKNQVRVIYNFHSILSPNLGMRHEIVFTLFFLEIYLLGFKNL